MGEMLVDGKVDIYAICQDAGWHRATAIQGAMEAGLTYKDATAYVAAYFAQESKTHDQRFEDHLTDDQWSRLQLVARLG